MFKNTNLYGYSFASYLGGKGIILAHTKWQAKRKVIIFYSKQGYKKSEFENLDIWKIKDKNNDVIEIWE